MLLKKFFSLCTLFLALELSAQEIKIQADEVLVNGRKICSVKKTKGGNMLTTAMPEFTVYDINGVARMKFSDVGEMVFLDDNKSYLPRVCDASVKSVGKFIASDTLFTPDGYNVAYRAAFIKKYNGVDASIQRVPDAGGKISRDKNAPVQLVDWAIRQDGQVIGYYSEPYRYREPEKQHTFIIMDATRTKIATIVYKEPVQYKGQEIEISTVKDTRTFKRIDVWGNGVVVHLEPDLMTLIKNGYL